MINRGTLAATLIVLFQGAAFSADPPTSGEDAALAADNYGSVKGTFILDGDLPQLPPKLAVGGVGAAAACGPGMIVNERLVVDPDSKGIKDIFVWISRFNTAEIPLELRTPTAPIIELSQRGCTFLPHGLVAQTGQTLVMRNHDPIPHNVHVHAIRGVQINVLVAPNDRAGVKRTLSKADGIVPVPIACDIHPWMKAHMLVLDHPYGTVSDTDGQFIIKGLPKGQYDFKIWHETTGFLRDVVLKDIRIQGNEIVHLGDLALSYEEGKLTLAP